MDKGRLGQEKRPMGDQNQPKMVVTYSRLRPERTQAARGPRDTRRQPLALLLQAGLERTR